MKGSKPVIGGWSKAGGWDFKAGLGLARPYLKNKTDRKEKGTQGRIP